MNMFRSETEGTGIKLFENDSIQLNFSESEGTDTITSNTTTSLSTYFKFSFMLLVMFCQVSLADIGYIHNTEENGVYSGLIIENSGKTSLIQGVIENNKLVGFVLETNTSNNGMANSVDDGTGNSTDSVDDGTGNSTDSVDDGTGNSTDSVDDGTGYSTESVDDGTGYSTESVDDGTGDLISIDLLCSNNSQFDVEIESEQSSTLTTVLSLQTLYINDAAVSCGNLIKSNY